MSSLRESLKRKNEVNPKIEAISTKKKDKDWDFKDIEFLAMIAHSIAGGVESPLQLTFQVIFSLELSRSVNQKKNL